MDKPTLRKTYLEKRNTLSDTEYIKRNKDWFNNISDAFLEGWRDNADFIKIDKSNIEIVSNETDVFWIYILFSLLNYYFLFVNYINSFNV